MWLLDLPDCCLARIMLAMGTDPAAIGHTACCCRALKIIASENSLWAAVYRLRWPEGVGLLELQSHTNGGISVQPEPALLQQQSDVDTTDVPQSIRGMRRLIVDGGSFADAPAAAAAAYSVEAAGAQRELLAQDLREKYRLRHAACDGSRWG